MPTSEHVNRLTTTRFAWDILGSSNLVIARTDSESAKLISSSIDARDHEFIKGAYNLPEGTKSLAETLAEKEAQGAIGAEIDAAEKAWMDSCELLTFNEGELPPNRTVRTPERMTDLLTCATVTLL